MEKNVPTTKPGQLPGSDQWKKLVKPASRVHLALAAFDIGKYGDPDPKTSRIFEEALRTVQHLQKLGGIVVEGVIQAEFADLDHESGLFRKAVTRCHCIGAFPMTPQDISDSATVLKVLRSPQAPAEKVFRDDIERIIGATYGSSGIDQAFADAQRHPSILTGWFNYFLSQPDAFKAYAGKVQFAPRLRPELGVLGYEEHAFPAPELFPAGLPPYQCYRVNRDILSIMFPSAVRPPAYVATRHVVERLGEIAADDVILAFGWWAHAPRVRRQIWTELQNRGVAIAPHHVIECPVHGPWVKGAQYWASSEELFVEVYERLADRI